MTPPNGPVVGVVGAGQLARMMVPAAQALAIRLRVLATEPGESAAQVIPDVVLGSHTDLAALRRLADGCDVVTFDHEHVPQEHLVALAADGVVLRPGPTALAHTQDKLHMRQALAACGFDVPAFATVQGVDDVVDRGRLWGWPLVVKTISGGYDGKGVWVLRDEAHARELIPTLRTRLMVEQFIPFDYEISAQVARSPSGQAVAYPVVRSVQTDGICTEVVAPDPDLSDDSAMTAQQIALRIAEVLDVVGMLAVEMFVQGDRLIINELAMRPHNSGHWSIDGAVTSQFENHLRAVLDLPLGDPSPLAAHTVMVNVLGGDYEDMHRAFLHCMARDPGVRIHLYGKAVRPGRKVGHVTTVGDDLTSLRSRARHAADFMRGLIDE